MKFRNWRSWLIEAQTLAVVAVGALLPACSSNSPSNDVEPGAVSRIVYAVRQHTVMNGSEVSSIEVTGGMRQVIDYGRYVPGGRIEVLDLRSRKVENLLEDYPTADVSSLDLSFDATKLLFTMQRDASDSYHVYWTSFERGAQGKYEIHQLTFGPSDDQNALWAAGGRIVFVTNQPYTEMGTRADEYNHSRAVTQLASISFDRGDADRKLCSQNLSHTATLFSMQDGRIGFSRWEHLENINDVKLFAMNPDCTQMIALSGQHGKPGNSVVQVTEATSPYVFYGVVTRRDNTIQAGALVRLDARGSSSLAQFDEEKSSDSAYTVLTPSVPRDDSPSPIGRYRSPAVLPDGRVLVSWADGWVNDLNELYLTPPDYGVYIFNESQKSNQLVINYETSWELYAKPIAARPEPPILPSRQDTVDASIASVFGSIDVRQTSLFARHQNRVSGAQFDGTPLDQALTQTQKVRIIEGFSSEGAPGVSMFGLTMAEGAALIGEAKVEADGSWLASIPPYVPVHLQPIDEYDLAIRNQTTWIQGMPGEARVCGGCHEDRSSPITPGGQALTIAAGRGPENFLKPVLERTEYPWANAKAPHQGQEIQKILDAKCVSCHNEQTNGDKPQEFYEVIMRNPLTSTETRYKIPRLDLSSREITVTYDRGVQSLPASYVSLFYPAALAMEMGKNTEITGKIPPKWAIPSDARNSALIEKLNVVSALTPGKFAWALGGAFSDPDIAGGTRSDHASVAKLTREELTALIRSIDMGGQYYSRQNTNFTPNQTNPVASPRAGAR